MAICLPITQLASEEKKRINETFCIIQPPVYLIKIFYYLHGSWVGDVMSSAPIESERYIPHCCWCVCLQLFAEKKIRLFIQCSFFVPNQTQCEWGFIIVIPLCGSENLLCCNLHSRPFLGGRPANPL